MASDETRRNDYDPQDAVSEVDAARLRLGARLATTRYYRLVAASIVGVMFVALGMPYESLSFGSTETGIALTMAAVVLGPLWLRSVLRRRTGASFDRYRNGWTPASMILIGLLMLCVCLQVFAELDLAPLVGAVLAFAFTYLYELQLDRRLAVGQFPPMAGSDLS